MRRTADLSILHGDVEGFHPGKSISPRMNADKRE
jgi:hypothetical protein